MLVLPGGMPGTLNLDKDPTVNNAIDVLSKKGNPIAAICAAPSILGKRGLLEGHKACCFPGFEEELKGADVIMDKKVVVDGNFITSPGMGCSVDFGLAILEYMQGAEAKDEMAKRIEFGTRN
jgi:4-methyl-5(b-hydroxyethyl)-thiazole monophosphate biosynthesis